METEKEIKNLKIEIANINRTLNAILKAVATLQEGEINRLKADRRLKSNSLKQRIASNG